MPKQVQTDLIHRYYWAPVNDWFVESRLICNTAQLESGFLIWCSVCWRCWTEDIPEEEAKLIFAHRARSVSITDLVWLQSQEDSFPKEQAELRMCATASPWHSHHNQFGGSCHARATAVRSSEARTQLEKKYICSLNPLLVLQSSLPASSLLQSKLGGAGGRCPT